MSFQIDIQKTTALIQQGNFKTALKSAKIAMKRHRLHPIFPNLAGVALAAMGREREAIPLFQKALTMDPEYHDARRNLGAGLLSLNLLDKAETVLSKATRLQPQDGQSWLFYSALLEKIGKLELALDAITQARALLPPSATLIQKHAEILRLKGEIDLALSTLQEAQKLEPDNLSVLHGLSDLLIYQVRTEDASVVLEQASNLKPDDAATLGRQSTLFLSQGREVEARAALEKILALDPSNDNALENLAGFPTEADSQKLEGLVQAALQAQPGKSLQRASLLFASGHLARRKKDISGAEEFYRKANKEVASIHGYQPKEEEDLDRAIVSGYADLPTDLVGTISTPAPIYVVGMPRSGTTLTEAILASHPEVAALGERDVDETLASGFLHGRSFGSQACSNLAETTHKNLPSLPDRTIAYVDKMPENHRFIGFLLAAQPDAKVVHLKRDPRDIALSQWHILFGKASLPYTYDFKAMAHRFNLYAQMMKFWHSVLPGRILDIHYEDLVSDVEAGSKQLAEHCGLNWCAEMASHHHSVGLVQTASQHQIRQPVHSRSVGKWRGKEKLLEPFVKALDPQLWPEIQED